MDEVNEQKKSEFLAVELMDWIKTFLLTDPDNYWFEKDGEVMAWQSEWNPFQKIKQSLDIDQAMATQGWSLRIVRKTDTYWVVYINSGKQYGSVVEHQQLEYAISQAAYEALKGLEGEEHEN